MRATVYVRKSTDDPLGDQSIEMMMRAFEAHAREARSERIKLGIWAKKRSKQQSV